MKFALGEKEVIVQRRGKEEAEKKLKIAYKEKEDLTSKMKALSSEKTRVQQIADSRVSRIIFFTATR